MFILQGYAKNFAIVNVVAVCSEISLHISWNIHFCIQFYDSWKVRNSILRLQKERCDGLLAWENGFLYTHTAHNSCHYHWDFCSVCVKLYVHSEQSEGLKTMPYIHIYRFKKIRTLAFPLLEIVREILNRMGDKMCDSFMFLFAVRSIYTLYSYSVEPKKKCFLVTCFSLRDKLWELFIV